MRILLVNPDMTDAMTQTMFAIAQGIAGNRAEIVPLTATRGFPNIVSRAKAQIAGGIAVEMIAENVAGADAVIIAVRRSPPCGGARAFRSVCRWHGRGHCAGAGTGLASGWLRDQGLQTGGETLGGSGTSARPGDRRTAKTMTSPGGCLPWIMP